MIMSANILNTKLANALLSHSPLMSLSVKITDSIVAQISHDIKTGSLSIEQWFILNLIDNGSALYPSQLGQLMDLALPQITRLVDELEGKSLITRQVDTTDRRKFKLLLSVDGKVLVNKLKKICSYAPVLDQLSLSEAEKALYKCIDAKCATS